MFNWFRRNIYCTHPSVVQPTGHPDACEACMWYLGEEGWFWKKLQFRLQRSAF